MDYKTNFFRQLRNFVENDTFVDVVLKVEQKKYSCHKLVLSTSSCYFEKMFLSGFKEQNSFEIELFGISSIGFDEIYQIYLLW